MIPQPKNIPQVFAIEGLDRLGKSTLIEGIRNALGYFEVIHFSRPQRLRAYENLQVRPDVPVETQQLFEYQRASFLNSMLLAKSGGRIIFDRWHLGEAVYAPLYRKYDGNYVFQQELDTGICHRADIRLILLVENFERSEHFVDDGNSLGPVEKRREEQDRFLEAIEKSNLPDKRVICVTDLDTGYFRSRGSILSEALA